MPNNFNLLGDSGGNGCPEHATEFVGGWVDNSRNLPYLLLK